MSVSQSWIEDAPIAGYKFQCGDTLVRDDWTDRGYVDRCVVEALVRRARMNGYEPVDSGDIKWERTGTTPGTLCPADGSECWRVEGRVLVAAPRVEGDTNG